ncbi:hypothetical protein ABZ154_06855 [Streptomyces sp. NPDC006261]|uniref:hypothetical protein n=1 Tax=Streptomyces sp. NPDC006261 TaxID=3156739 RepID=UPI0033A33E37
MTPEGRPGSPGEEIFRDALHRAAGALPPLPDLVPDAVREGQRRRARSRGLAVAGTFVAVTAVTLGLSLLGPLLRQTPDTGPAVPPPGPSTTRPTPAPSPDSPDPTEPVTGMPIPAPSSPPMATPTPPPSFPLWSPPPSPPSFTPPATRSATPDAGPSAAGSSTSGPSTAAEPFTATPRPGATS